jgi:membrane fusion protein, heavy metal efflux system
MLEMEPTRTTVAEEVMSTQPDQDTLPLGSTGAKPTSAKFSSRIVLITGVTIAVAVNTVLMFGGSKSPSSSGPASTTVPAEEKQSVKFAPSAVAAEVVKLEEGQQQHFPLAPASPRLFRVEKHAPGKIAFNEDALTPVFSFYTGRIVRLIAKPGDLVEPGSPLLEIDTPDLMQTESDLLTAASALAKAKTALNLAHRTESRLHDLYLHNAIALKDWEQAQADLHNAENDVRAAEAVLAATRGRLRVLGKSAAEIAQVERGQGIARVARVVAPIAGTIIARKVGPGQYVRPDNAEPLFLTADLSTMWMLANVSETDVPLMQVGQPVAVQVMAYPDEVFTARIDYIGAVVDATTHRVNVRCVVDNPAQKLKPEMFATFHIVTTAAVPSLAVPVSALVREGEKVSVWVAQPEQGFIQRTVTVGLEQEGYAQILSGLQPGERVVSAGSLFLSNAARS